MTSKDDVREMVLNSSFDDWEMHDGQKALLGWDDEDLTGGTWVYAGDVDLRIERATELHEFNEDWTSSLPGDNTLYEYYVCYRTTPVEKINIVSVDGHRAAIPLPDQPEDPSGAYTISDYKRRIGEIVTDDQERFRDYLDRTGVEVQ